MKLKLLFVSFLCWFSISAFCLPAPPIEFERITIEMGGRDYELEYAKTMSQRARGLMFRDKLCRDCGMLFVFDIERIGSIWMKNTEIPLDLAYVDSSGEIVDIFQLKPHDLTPVRSSKPVAYAIEMNKGWFARKKIAVGDSINVKFSDIKDRN